MHGALAQRVGACSTAFSQNGRRRIVKVPSGFRVYAFGAVLCLSMLLCSWYFGDRGGPGFMVCLTLAAIAYLLAMREFFATPTFPRRLVIIGLIVAAVWHIAFLRLPPGADDD